MRHLPTHEYSGLTVVLSNPSRMDKYKLISGTAGHFFETECLTVSRTTVDIRTADTIGDGILPGTKGLLLLGDKAFHSWSNEEYKVYGLSEQRGNPLRNKWNIPTIASYSPQDAIDRVDHESRLNPLAQHEDEDHENEDEEEDAFATKAKGKTKRANYRFWLKHDTRKILRFALPDGRAKQQNLTAVYRIAPSTKEVLDFLCSITAEQNLYLDIETSIDGGYNVFCIGLSTDDSPIYVVPILGYNFLPFYSDLHLILGALAGAIERATLVCHNGYAFDLIILSWRYGIPIGRKNYDTLIAQHRTYPEVEKSLGHCISLWLWEPYHKDQGIFTPHNMQQYRQLLEYNGVDIATMRALKWALDANAKKVPGLEESIRQGNRCIYPYVLAVLNGMPFDQERRSAIMKENDALMEQYLRMIGIFREHLGYKENLLPTSSQSCAKFFHGFLNYEVVGRSKSISKKTGKPTNNPSLNEKNFWKLKLKYPDNALIDLCVRYRQVKKDSGMLKFEPWNFYALPTRINEDFQGILEGPEELAESED